MSCWDNVKRFVESLVLFTWEVILWECEKVCRIISVTYLRCHTVTMWRGMTESSVLITWNIILWQCEEVCRIISVIYLRSQAVTMWRSLQNHKCYLPETSCCDSVKKFAESLVLFTWDVMLWQCEEVCSIISVIYLRHHAVTVWRGL